MENLKARAKNLLNLFGNAALVSLVLCGDIQLVHTMLEEGLCSDVNVVDRSGITALIAASTGGHTLVVQALLQRGADANLQV